MLLSQPRHQTSPALVPSDVRYDRGAVSAILSIDSARSNMTTLGRAVAPYNGVAASGVSPMKSDASDERLARWANLEEVL